MELFQFVRIIILSIPLGIFLTFGLLVLVAYIISYAKLKKSIKYVLFFYCLSSLITSYLFLTYFYYPAVFSQFDILYGASIIFSIVLFHHLLCITIGLDSSFNLKHYVLGMLVCAGMLIFKLVYLDIWIIEGQHAMLIITILFGILHSMLSFIKVHEHHLTLTIELNTTETLDKTRAIPFIVEILMFPWVFGVCLLITGPNPGIMTSLVLMGSILLALWMNIPLTYSLIRHYSIPFNEVSFLANEVVVVARGAAVASRQNEILPPKTSVTNGLSNYVKPKQKSRKGTGEKRIYRRYSAKHRSSGQLIEIDRRSFERYIQRNKPYLNPNLTIQDLTEPLQNNRTYISRFINRVYHMNFSHYINMYRLKEMDNLMGMPENKNIPLSLLCKKAGFSTYRNYLRAKKISEEPKEFISE